MSSELWFSLFILAKLGAKNKKIEISSINFAKDIQASQQTASRRIIELEKLNWIIRKPSGKSQFIQITEKGQEKLKEVFEVLKNIFEKEQRFIEIEGELFQGMGEGGYYVTREAYKNQFLEKLGFSDLYPGTLNLRLTSKEALKNRELLLKEKSAGIQIQGFKNESRTYGPVICFKCLINDKIQGAVLNIKRTHHEENVIEIISPTYLREVLELKDGDRVNIKVYLNPD